MHTALHMHSVLLLPDLKLAQLMPLRSECSNYSLLDTSGNTDDCETEGEPVSCTGEICSVEEWSSEDFIVALALHSTAGRYH